MVEWLQEHCLPSEKILDLGCGNGHLIFALFEVGFTDLHGCDYSQKSLELCRAIAAQEYPELGSFFEMDILKREGLDTRYKVLLDKGSVTSDLRDF
jgi:ribosomal protein L11 methylase PrmA